MELVEIFFIDAMYFRNNYGDLMNEDNKFKLEAIYPNTSSQFVNCGQLTLPQEHICGECGKGYKWRENLYRHQRLECGKLPTLRCKICMKMFYRRYELTNHLKMKHHKA
ncbi:zinc finger protein 350-like [Temnothorax curvispinosus]|uniref:Zinc finger protein 350-like n=1 Tax=Temnothorax curvispinosus TaxID=300111 RepID=A0A6J1PGE1_9HYME|nr:zinc finger protein 350-like [Temnothorax curvispinosus]